MMQSSAKPSIQAVQVNTSARLHLGFIDLNGSLGRKFGSLGVSLASPTTTLTAWREKGFHIMGEAHARALNMAKKIAEAYDLTGGVKLEFQSSIPEHSGLGSGTQLAIAVGSAINALYDLQLSVEDIANITQRGARSGIGLGTFTQGGVIVDGGRGLNTAVPPILAHADFPEDWCILLLFDAGNQGVHGAQEVAAFKSLMPSSNATAEKLSRTVMMQALPALHEHDFSAFGAAVRELQNATGDYFAPIQGGRYASRNVAEILEWCAVNGLDCYGQSSWGPTGFIMFADSEYAQKMKQRLQQEFAHLHTISFVLTKGQNRGGFVREIERLSHINCA